MEPPVTNPKRVSIEKDKALLNNPEDMFKLLSWQSEQITKLQEQVDQLVAWKSKAEVSIHSIQNSSMSTNRYVADEILIFSPSDFHSRKITTDLIKKINIFRQIIIDLIFSSSSHQTPPRKQMVCASTQVSAPSSPQKFQESVNRSQLRKERTINDEFETRLSLATNDQILQPSRSMPLGASAAGYCLESPRHVETFTNDDDNDEEDCDEENEDFVEVDNLDDLIVS